MVSVTAVDLFLEIWHGFSMAANRYMLTDEQRSELIMLVRNSLEERVIADRARMVLWWDEGVSARAIAALLRVSPPTVYLWPARFAKSGIEGLYNAPRSVPPLVHDGRVRARILALTRQSPPAETALRHWSSREMARYLRRAEGIVVSHTFIADLWRESNLQPYRWGIFRLSTDPGFQTPDTAVADRFQHSLSSEIHTNS
ncbi:integrase catalytic subunit [Candidatus Protofrankia californiensis]|uniref:Integrase catalytic subunit n=1 Tax=Candidatus Protofrankia californiensis TaxID=1839754 RepID=A0A1C3NYU7_9ACTN|nr:integrase catalytic subunit [Candidatus Protofrankia californiensis]